MKRNKKMNFLIILAAAFNLGYAQSDQKQSNPPDNLINYALAGSYLHGTGGHAYNPQKAFQLYERLAVAGDAASNNAVGNLYFRGIGVAQDLEQALKYFEKAATLGYTAAFINSGKLYSEGIGNNQDFRKAFAHFKRAAENNDIEGKKLYAYYLYKGFGGVQDYRKAYMIFSELSEKGDSWALYYKALCLRNGYGVERNIELAKKMLVEAQHHGQKSAGLELEEPEPENPQHPIVLPFKSSVFDFYTKGNEDYKRIKHNANVGDLTGSYDGYAIKYDWSGKNIVEYWPLSLSLNSGSNILEGKYSDKDGEVNMQARLTDNGIEFLNTSFFKTDHYTPEKKIKQFKNAQLQVVNAEGYTQIVGKLNLFVPFRNEPEKPVVIYLRSTSRKSLPTSNPLQIEAFPNPVTDMVKIQFTISSGSRTQVTITDILGNVIKAENAGYLIPGVYLRSIYMKDLSAGVYNIKIITDNSASNAKIVKQ